jgi:hypothetical protein
VTDLRRLAVGALAWFGGIVLAWVAAVWVWLVLDRREVDPAYDRQPYLR